MQQQYYLFNSLVYDHFIYELSLGKMCVEYHESRPDKLPMRKDLQKLSKCYY